MCMVALSCVGRLLLGFVVVSLTAHPEACASAGEMLNVKYGRRGPILRGSAELFRLSAVHAPLPGYPNPLRQAGRGGLVVIELVVSPAGGVVESLVLESFDEKAAAEVTATVATWRFRSEKEMMVAGLSKGCKGCLRVNRLAFDFVILKGRGMVVDLAERAVKGQAFPDPFHKGKE